MKVSCSWLEEFVDLPSTHDLVETLTRAGAEVEGVFDPTGALANVVVARVEECTPHPKADKLKVCSVFDGESRYTVVCGAPNVREGLTVALARVGAEISGMQITPRALRGVESHGMLCSRDELGLGPSSAGLWELPDDWTLGAPIAEQPYVSAVLDISITPNRPDLLSHIGIAREIVAATGKKPKGRGPGWRPAEKGPDVNSLVRVVVDDVSACRRYAARVVRNVKVGPSPRWLRERLEAVGQRSINNVVDVTNYVLLELGHPLHAFDLARLEAQSGVPTIRVRRAEPGETLLTLDEQERALATTDLVIADATKPVALAGVMGGANSEVGLETTSVLLESAWFDPATVRATAKRFGLHTEASHRFERGADMGGVIRALDRCAHLIADVSSGEVAKGVIDVNQSKTAEAGMEVTLRLGQVARILGVSLPAEDVVKLLDPLEIRCTSRNESSLRFQTPSFRPDLQREVDLIEEIARRYGYDKIPERMPNTGGAYHFEPLVQNPVAIARQSLLASGVGEVITYGFGSPKGYSEASAVRLLNPLGEEYSVLRTSLLPGLLSVVARNQRQGVKWLRIFEIGTTFHKQEPRAALAERDRDLPHQPRRVACVLWGSRHAGRWYEGGERIDFSDLAGTLENLVDAFDLAPQVLRHAEAIEPFNPHAAARVRCEGLDLGAMGEVHPQMLARYDVAGPVFAFELDLEELSALPKRQAKFIAPAKYPGMRRDIALVAPKQLQAETLRRFLTEQAGGKLGSQVVESVRLFDVYEGTSISEDRVSLAFAIQYRSRERTLTEPEIAEAFESLMTQVRQVFPQVEVRA